MKLKYFLLTAIIIPSIIYAKFDLFEQLEFKKADFNFYGSAYNGKSIIVFGNSGDILRSTDGGANWEQLTINDDFIIKGITNLGKDFYGILHLDYGIISTDNGKNWQMIKVGENINFNKLVKYNNQLYCQTNNKILVFGNNFQKINEFDYSTDTSIYDFAVTNNVIIYSAGKGKIGYINLNSNEQTIYDLEALSICTGCATPANFFADDYNVYFWLGKQIYQFYTPTKSIELFLEPTYLVNRTYTTYQNQIFNIFTTTSNLYYQDSLRFVQYFKLNKNPQFINQKNLDRRAYQLSFNNLHFLSKDTIIAVGNKKLIITSYDGGISWKIRSIRNPLSQFDFYIFDSLNAKAFFPGVLFSYTTNGGVTWLVSKSFNPLFKNFSFDFATGFINQKAGFMTYSRPYTGAESFAFTFDGRETFNVRNEDTLRDNDMYVSITKPNKSILFANNFTKGYGNYVIIYYINDSLRPKRLTFLKDIHILGADFSTDRIITIGKIAEDVKDTAEFAIFTSSDDGISWTKEYSLDIISNLYMQDLRYAKCIDSNFYFQFKASTAPPNDSNSRDVKFTFHYNTQTKKLSLLWVDTSKSNIFNFYFTIANMEKLCGKYLMHYYYTWDIDYTTGRPRTIFTKICENPASDPTKWEDLDINTQRYRPVWGINSLEDNTIALLVFDSLASTDILLFAKEKQASAVVETPTIEQTPSLYISRPIPNPARNSTTMRIYYDSRFDIERADFRAYNMIGMQVAGKEAFTLTRLNHYSSDLSWNFAGLPSGVYLVVVRLGGETRSVAVVVE